MTRNSSLASIPTEATPPTDTATWERLTAALEALAKPAPTVDPELQCLTPAQLADLLGVSLNWVTERITRREIPFTFVGRFPRFLPRHIRAITEANEVDPAAVGRKAA